MSMSSLSAQLASLQKSSTSGTIKHAGSSLTSSKAHKDAIGRGLAHSVQHGHSVNYGSNNTLYKPSVLYADSKSASDVPLTTLRENCISSLRQLAKLTGNSEFVSSKYIQTLCGIHSLEMERGLLTASENNKLDGLIQDLLILCMTAMGESSNTSSTTTSTTNCFSSSLHVMEYLLRRHDVHKREATAEFLVKCVLPFHEEPIFQRVLQLVNLAELPTFTVLRPFAQVLGDATLPPPPSRTVLAKHVSRDNALVKVYCDLAQQAAQIHASNECDSNDDKNNDSSSSSSTPPRRGISRCISFAAAVLLEALQLQVTSTNKYHGSISEFTLRVILPYVLQACGNTAISLKCRDWRGFGHVFASWIGKHVVLSHDARTTLATIIVDGALATQQTFRNDQSVQQQQQQQQVADCLATLMAVLSTSPNKECDSKLKVVSRTIEQHHHQFIGYDLPLETYKKLIQLNNELGKAIGCLYNDLNLDVTSLVASIVAIAISRLSRDTNGSIQVLLDLIQQEQLALSLWKNATLTATVAAAVLDQVANLSESKCTETVVEGIQNVIGALKTVNPSGCDAGIAHAVTTLCQGNNNKNDVRSRLVQVLGFSQDGELDVSTTIDEDVDMNDLSTAMMLPPRVALEHANPSVRLHAIERLTKDGTYSGSVGVGESLQEALLRHFLVEDEMPVVVAAGKALVSLVKEKDSPSSFDVTSPAFANDCLKALEKWTLDASTRFPTKDEEAKYMKERDKKKKKNEEETLISTSAVSEERACALEVALEIAGYAADGLSSTKDDNALLIKNLLLQAIIAHFDVMESHAGRALSNAIGGSKKKAAKDPTTLLLTEEILLSGLRSCWNNEDMLPESSFSLRYLDVYSQALADALVAPGKSKRDDSIRAMVSDALNTCVLVVQSEGDMEMKKVESVVERFYSCAKHVKVLDAIMLIDVVMNLSSVTTDHTFKSVCIPAIHRLCDGFSAIHGVSKLRILMEAALREDVSNVAVLRLVELAGIAVWDDKNESTSLISGGIVYILALLGHPEQAVRKAVLQLVGTAKGTPTDIDQVDILNAMLAITADETSNATSQILLNGSSALPSLLAGIVSKSQDPPNLMSELLKLCYRTSCSISDSSDDGTRWLGFEEGEGGCRAATIVLKALELSGEKTSPLLQRYSLAGRDILGALLDAGEAGKVTEHLIDLIQSVARMMKGVIVVDSSSVGSQMIISTGPSKRGTRTRSYSVGRSPGVSFIEPYPKTMRDDILTCLSYQEDDSAIKREMCRAVVHNVLGSPSWTNVVFKSMDKTSRKKILESLLCLWKAESIEGSGVAFLGLELGGKELADLMRVEGVKKPDVHSIIFLCDYIHTHTERLKTSTGYTDLVTLLFQTLETLSANEYIDEEEEDEAEFARQSLLRVLGRLVHSEENTADSKHKRKFPKKDLLKWAHLLVRLVGGSNKAKKLKQLLALPFGRPKFLAFSLLTSLCSDDPSSIVKMLVPAMLDSIVLVDSSDAERPSKIELRVSNEIFDSVVPVFFKYAATAGLNQFDLYNQVLAKAVEIEDEKRRMALFSRLVDPLTAIPSVEVGSTSPIGCFIAAIVAFDVRSNGPEGTTEMSSALNVAAQVLQTCSPTIQVSSLTQLVGYAHDLLTKIDGTEQIGDENQRILTETSTNELETSILFDAESTGANQQMYRASTALSILSIVSQSLATTPVMNLVIQGNEEASRLSLSLWQDLLMLQSACGHGKREEDDRFWEECQQLIDSSLEQLQSLIPAHLFLASAALLIEDDSDAELCARAIGLVSERAANTDSESPEASLFLDMLTLLSGLLVSTPDSMTDEDTECTILVQQSVFVAVEIFARSLCLKSNKDYRGRLDAFTDVLKHATTLITLHSSRFGKHDQVVAAVDSPSCQILCSAALCASTLVRLLTVRSIPFLPDLVGSLLSILCSINQSPSGDKHWSVANKGNATVLQVSILRLLLALTDTLPQFLGPYLDRLFSPSALLSSSVRIDDTEQQVAVSSLASKLGAALSQKIPARQLIPSLCKSLPICTKHGELQAILTMLQESVQQAPRSEVPALRSWLVKALMLAYEFQSTDGSSDEAIHLVQEANSVLLALVMKLSEAQLRPLYAKFREWRGDLDSDSESVIRRHAFWSLSALLSSQLRSIFLPCLSTVVSDAVQQLELATAQLCGSSSSKKDIDGGRKRQRLEVTQDSIIYLKPLLSCLESALHADAIEGGKWIRHDDSQRYHSLLSPLSKLLELDATSLENTTYHDLVHGIEKDQDGSVIRCLTALASAAGNEQLWKPLNHAVLQACGNESRSEVRKGGVSCLLSLIKALGEEYMVLLPECLPVLSEMLEETSEEIAGLAQECVSLGEELLGESLEDSLR